VDQTIADETLPAVVVPRRGWILIAALIAFGLWTRTAIIGR